MKYKIGDKFKVIESNGFFDEGEIVTLIGAADCNVPLFSNGKAQYYKDLKRVEAVSEPKFKKGDRVRIGLCTNRGQIATITRLDKEFFYMDCDNGKTDFHSGNCLTLLEEIRFKCYAPLELIIDEASEIPDHITDALTYAHFQKSSNKKSEEERVGENKMANFKVGDKVRIKESSEHSYQNAQIGNGILTEVPEDPKPRTMKSYKFENGYGNSYEPEEFELISEAKTDMRKLTASQEKNLSKDAQALVKAGYYESDLTLASESHFRAFLLNKFESEYAAVAQAELDAAKVEEKKAKKA